MRNLGFPTVTTSAVCFSILLSLAILAGGCLLALWWFWAKIGEVVNDLVVKIVAKLIQSVAGITSLSGAYADTAGKGEWFPAVVTGVVCVVLWEVIEKIVDSRVKSSDRLGKDALSRAERESETRTELLSTFRKAADMKTRRLIARVRRRGPKPRVEQLRSALTPDNHLDFLLTTVAVYFETQPSIPNRPTRNFRVGLYAVVSGILTPLRAVNLNTPNYDVFRSYREHEAAFRIDAELNPSHAVVCVRNRSVIVVDDCEAAATAGQFFFFDSHQRTYLRSMVAFYLDQVCLPDGTMTVAALVVDTDEAGFFKTSERDSLEFALREFATRIKLEMALVAMLAAREGSE